MKAVGLIFLTLGCAAWTFGAAYPAQSVATAQQTTRGSAANAMGNHTREAEHAAPNDRGTHIGKPSDDQQNSPKVSGNKSPISNPSPSKSNRPNEIVNRRERSVSEDSKNSDRSGADRSAGAARNGLARSETVNHAPSIREPSAVRPSVPSLSNVRHRGPNPAIVGGLGSSNARNTAALDGAHMNRKRLGN